MKTYELNIRPLSPWQKDEERWRKCSEFTNNYYPEAISVGFINAFFGRKERQNAEELVNYVRKEFNLVLDNLEWIDDETKSVAMEKLSKMILAVGFPDEVSIQSLSLLFFLSLSLFLFFFLLSLSLMQIDLKMFV